MSTVPNRYYNSPWIAEAGQNLAAALAPPDPEKTLAAQRNKWLFDRQQQLAQLEDEDRVKHDAGIVSLGELLSGGGKPVAPTSPGEAAYFSANPAAAGGGMDDATFQRNIRTALEGNIPLASVVTAAGPRGSAYEAQRGTLDDKQAAALRLRELMGDQSMGRAIFGADAAMQRAQLTDDRVRDIATDNAALRRELAILRGEQGAAHDQRVTDRGPGGGTPLDISPTDDTNLGYAVDDWAERHHVTLSPEEWSAMKNRTSKVYQGSRNATTAVDQAGVDIYGEHPEVVQGETHYFRPNDPNTLKLRDGKSLADIVRGFSQPAVAPAPAAKTPMATQGQLPTQPAATPLGAVATGQTDAPPVELFTPGEALAFDDGSVWTLVNGVPTRIDNGG